MKKKSLSILICLCLLWGCGNVTASQSPPESADSVNVSADAVESADPATSADASADPEKSQPEISLVMVGDVLMHTPVSESGLQDDGTYNYDALFEHTRDQIQEADLALVNQEVILGGEELGISGYPLFNARYEVGDALVNAGFNVILHATNHAMDQGKEGILNCLNFWETNYPDIAVLGIYDSQEARDNIYIYEQDGMKIAILNYTFSTNGIDLPSDMPYAVNLLDESTVTADIQKAEEEADFTIVCPHWGTEYQLTPDSNQEKWTQIFLENGVDLVIGTHPHVIEPIEMVSDDQGHNMLVYYSLGNYVNYTSGEGDGVANRAIGGMAQVTLTEEEGQVVISDYGVEAVICQMEEGTNGVTAYFYDDYDENLAESNDMKNKDSAFTYDYISDLCDQVWGDLWH